MNKLISIILLWTVSTPTFSQNNLDCDSIHAYFDSLGIETVGLMYYDESARPSPGFEEFLFIKSMDSTEGKVFVRFVIDEAGNPRCGRVIKSSNVSFNERALSEIAKIKFVPAKRRGKPVIASMTLPVTFGNQNSLKKEIRKYNKRKN